MVIDEVVYSIISGPFHCIILPRSCSVGQFLTKNVSSNIPSSVAELVLFLLQAGWEHLCKVFGLLQPGPL